jgi:FkbM family methyltransferase
VVVDVGAHIGAHSLRVAKIVGPNGLVVAIEPEPRNFKTLLKPYQNK